MSGVPHVTVALFTERHFDVLSSCHSGAALAGALAEVSELSGQVSVLTNAVPADVDLRVEVGPDCQEGKLPCPLVSFVFAIVSLEHTCFSSKFFARAASFLFTFPSDNGAKCVFIRCKYSPVFTEGFKPLLLPEVTDWVPLLLWHLSHLYLLSVPPTLLLPHEAHRLFPLDLGR